MDIELAKKIAISAAKKAGKVLDDNFFKVKNMSLKGKSDIVTELDIKAEKIILNLITSHFPDHAVLSEEAGMVGKHSSEYIDTTSVKWT